MTELPPFNSPPPKHDEGGPVEDIVSGEPQPLAEPSAPDRWQGIRSVFAWILRWALLGAGVGGAWLFGILVAQFFPAPNPDPPAQEIVTRRTSRFFQKLGRLPAWWSGDDLSSETPIAPRLESNPPTPPPPTSPVTLSDAEREQVAVELDAVETEIQSLRDRTSALEQQLGLPTVEVPLEERVDNVANRLSPPAETATQPPPPTPTAVRQPTPGAAPDPLFQVNAYRVTLPSDVLFVPGQAILQSNAQPLLDSILQDVGRYPNATIVVGSYTDIATEEATPTELSYQQAIAVQRYLSQRLADNAAHWVAVGYGNTNLGSTGGVQLSRRITLAIVP